MPWLNDARVAPTRFALLTLFAVGALGPAPVAAQSGPDAEVILGVLDAKYGKHIRTRTTTTRGKTDACLLLRPLPP